MTILHNGTFCEQHGVADGPAVVLIHGLGLTGDVWQWTAPALIDRYRVITYDLYGHGRSVAPSARPSLTLFATQLAEVMDAHDAPRAVIVGFSLGGMICRRFAMDYPDRAQALAILNSPHRRMAAAQAAILKRVEQAKAAGPAATVEAALERWFTERFRAANPDRMALVRGWVMGNDPAVYPSIYRVLADGIEEITDVSLNLPALVMTADEDFGNGPEMTRAIAAEINGAETVILEGLRHMALAEAPDAVNRPLRAFLDRITTQITA